MKRFEFSEEQGGVSRRSLLIGGGIGAGLMVAWSVWPRDYPAALHAGPGESIFNAWIKIGDDGRVIVAVPQAELGQGAYTLIPQIVADELGADWRTVAVEAAPISPSYANRTLIAEASGAARLGALGSAGGWIAAEYATRTAMMITAGSTSVRAFEAPAREAAAGARALLMIAAAKRWDVDWQACDTAEGFVTLGEDRIRFAELAAEAAGHRLPADLPVREGTENRLYGTNVPRLDLPAKVDGSITYAADVRLPDMVFAAIRQGPPGNTRLIGVDRAAADAVRGVRMIVETPRWVAAIANNWWSANQALDALSPKFRTAGKLPDDTTIEAALTTAIDSGDGSRLASQGDLEAAFRGETVRSVTYTAAMMPHAAIEPMCATAQFRRGQLELWIPTQAPTAARRAAAKAIGIAEQDVILHPTMAGGSFGRKLETDAASQAAILAVKAGRPVQLLWSRSEDMLHDRYRPPAQARMTARANAAGQILGWQTRIACPDTGAEQAERIGLPFAIDGGPVAGAVPPYAMASFALDHHPASIGIETGNWRSGAHSYTCFFTECFIDELAQARGIDPLLMRIQALGNEPRLAQCLSTAATMAGWQGGIGGSNQGLACHMMQGSRIAVVAEARIDENQHIRVDRLTAVVDCGRQPNPDIVRQQIEGGLIFGMANALGNGISIERGLSVERNFRDLALPVLADCPQIEIAFAGKSATTGGISEIGVPAVAPAIANALFTASGRRLRSLPLKRAA